MSHRFYITLFASLSSFSLLTMSVVLVETPRVEAQQQIAQLSTAQLRQIAQSITVKVLAKNSGGSGTLIGKKNQVYTVLTNAHVLIPGQPYRIQTPDGKTHQAYLPPSSLAKGGSDNDLALLQFKAKEEYAIATLATTPPPVNQEVWAAGFPFEADGLEVTTGRLVLVPDRALRGGYRLGYSNQVEQGMSGGPILNREGKAIGINGRSGYAIVGDPYVFQDGTQPTPKLKQQMQGLSWGVSMQTLAQLAPELVTDSSTQSIPRNPSTVTPQPEKEEGEMANKPLRGIAADVDKIAAAITVRIDSQNDNGSGVIIAKQGNTYYVLTADHVVQDEAQYQVVTPDGKKYSVNYSTVKKQPAVDLAVLQFTSNQNYSVATLGNYDLTVEDVQWVFVSGFPARMGNQKQGTRLFTVGGIVDKTTGAAVPKYNESLAQNLAETTSQGYELVYSNITKRGMSGGPVFDTRGRVIGIHAAVDGDRQYDIQLGLSLGVPVTTFFRLANLLQVKREWLRIETDVPPQLSQLENDRLQANLFSTEVPSASANEVVWVSYGNQLSRLGKYQEAVAAFDQALKIKPDFYLAWFARGQVLGFLNKYQEAADSFEKATLYKPDFYQAWRDRSIALIFLKKFPDSLVAIDRAISINSQDAVLYGIKGYILSELKQSQVSLAAYTESINIKPHPFAYFGRGRVRSDLGDNQGALADFNQAIQLKPNFSEAYLNRGNVRKNLGDKQGALADCDRAIQIKPNFAEAYVNRANVRKDLGDRKGAVEDLQKAVQLFKAQGNMAEYEKLMGVLRQI